MLLINAINLVDGLDGLAAGVVSFVCAVMVILSIMQDSFRTTVLFAALGGALLGFLRYNYNPASIFLGDGGSYFLGYMVAGLAIVGSVKSQVGAAITIPVLALGVPLFDTLLSPVRRFIRGRRPFRPDSSHVHHKLVGMGFTSKRAVLIIYMITAALSVIAVVMANVRDERAGLFLILLGAGAVYFIRKLGYLGNIRTNQLLDWLKDLSDEAGISRERRGFIDVQIEMARSGDLDQLWRYCVSALDLLELDMAELHLNGLKNELNPAVQTSWTRAGFVPEEALCKECQLKIELPLIDETIGHLGTLWLVKDLKQGAISHFTLKRIEHLRRTLNHVLKRMVAERR